MSARITYAGHATALIEMNGKRLLTDPLLRGRLLWVLRRHRGLERAALGDVDGILISHLHHDHLDLPTLRALGTSIPIVGPPGAGRFLRRRGFKEVTELAAGAETALGGVQVGAVEAHHLGGRIFGLGKLGCVGYLIEGEGRIYFAGDTKLFPGMGELGPGVDVALLPIWGWGPKLGPGHLDPETAAEALTLIHPRVAVPMHWGTLAPIGARRLWPWMFDRPALQFTEHARRLAPAVEVRVMEPGEELEVAPG